MRVAVGGIYHESNTFFSQPMVLERFAQCQLHYDTDVIVHWQRTCSEMAGFLRGAQELGFEAIPTMMAWGMPSGALTEEAFETLCGELTSRIHSAGKLDGVLLSLHGAMVCEKYPDADGEILRRVREAAGEGAPLVATLDFHANLTEQMVRWADILVGYDTYPHTDQAERGLEAAKLIHRMISHMWHPHMVLARRSLLPHILSQSTERPPMEEVIQRAHEFEERPDIACISVFAGFPYADVPDAGLTVVAVGETLEAATDAAETLAESVWKQRAKFDREISQPDFAVHEAMAQPSGLTVLVDVGDNLGAGTPGDGTVLLRELIKQHARDALVLLCDPKAVNACVTAGVRSTITLEVGAKCDLNHGAPVEISGTIRVLSDGVFRNVGPMRDGILEDQGRTAVVDVDGILVVLTERRMPMWNLQQLRAIGVEPAKLRIIVVKAAIAYRAAYAPIATKIVEVDTPGLSAADVRKLSYKRLRRPMFPLDPI